MNEADHELAVCDSDRGICHRLGLCRVKLLNGEYDVTVGAYIGLVCVGVMIVYYIYRIFSNKCPYCGKLIHLPRVQYCPHCGKKLEN